MLAPSRQDAKIWRTSGFAPWRVCARSPHHPSAPSSTLAVRLPTDYNSRNPTSEFDIMARDPVARHFFNGFIRLHILYHAAKEPIYGAEIAEELVRHGYRLGSGTLYPTLHLLEETGYLRRHRQLVQGRWRAYYRATSDGRKVLTEARQKLLDPVPGVLDAKD